MAFDRQFFDGVLGQVRGTLGGFLDAALPVRYESQYAPPVRYQGFELPQEGRRSSVLDDPFRDLGFTDLDMGGLLGSLGARAQRLLAEGRLRRGEEQRKIEEARKQRQGVLQPDAVPSSIPAAWRDHVAEAARQYGLDPALIAAIIQQESGGQQYATSPRGARGPMQLMPDTARALGVTDPYDVRQNILAGARYLREQLDRFGGNLELALAAYNAGPGAVQQHGGIPPYAETRAYVPAVLRRYREAQAEAQRAAQAYAQGQQQAAVASAPGAVYEAGGRYWQIAFDFDLPYATPLPGGTTRHRGVDLIVAGAPQNGRGLTYQAFLPGTVYALTNDPAGGQGIIVSGDDGLYHRYFHSDRVLVQVGQRVDQSTPLGVVGATGSEGFPHLHFEVARHPNGDRVPLDPRPYLSRYR